MSEMALHGRLFQNIHPGASMLEDLDHMLLDWSGNLDRILNPKLSIRRKVGSSLCLDCMLTIDNRVLKSRKLKWVDRQKSRLLDEGYNLTKIFLKN